MANGVEQRNLQPGEAGRQAGRGRLMRRDRACIVGKQFWHAHLAAKECCSHDAWRSAKQRRRH